MRPLRYSAFLGVSVAIHAACLAVAAFAFGTSVRPPVAKQPDVELELVEPPAPEKPPAPLPVAPSPVVPEPRVEAPPVPPEPQREPPPPPPMPVPEPPKPVESPPLPAKPEEVPMVGNPQPPVFQSLEVPAVASQAVPVASVPVVAPSPVRTLARNNAAYHVNPAPPYPEAARRAGVTGTVLLLVQVRPDGSVRGVSVRTSSGNTSLDRSAVTAVRRWLFEPARDDGVAVDCEVEVPIRFALQTE